MNMNNNSIKRRRLDVVYTWNNNNTRNTLKVKWKNTFLTFLMYSVIFFMIATIILVIILYSKYIVGLPSIKELENLEIAESSIIYDREWNELYKIFKEKRTYVPYENINKNMINAIIAIEDKRYWTNPWIDILWLIRAWVKFIFWSSNSVKGTSTLTQQLIRNTILKNEKSVERKVKELYLAYKLTSSVSKEKILELYLNKISYWNNAFGIEEAAKTYFNKSSKDLWILESSILASLPKWPTYYSPYNHPDRLVWYPYIYANDDKKNSIKIINKKDKESNKEILTLLTNFISGLKSIKLEWTEKTLICNIDKKYLKNNIKIDSDWCSIINYSELIDLLNSIKIKKESINSEVKEDTIANDNYIEYETWRKDRVLWRMLEDWYITFDEYKESIIKWIWYEFNVPKEKIKAAHFVFYVKEYLEKNYEKGILSTSWLKIYTTLDPKLQDKAEELILKQTKKNLANFNAKNAALISIDNKSWWILSMVWSRDYFDTDNKWNVNIITSKLQPWSTFKPFVYAMWIFNNEIWTKTPIYDLETKFDWNYTPKNFDWKFMWKMNISTALNYSRNIPAIKMYIMAWWEKKIVEFMKKLWVESLKSNWNYGAPLALWTWEMTPLELATAYSIFANLWEKKNITPIIRVTDSKGNIITPKRNNTEDNTKNIENKKVISEDQAYIINTILSDTSSRPAWWNNYISLKNRLTAAKTGTSTKQYTKKWKKFIFPNSLWTIWYTPQITTVVWAWNTDWSETNMSWDWLNATWPIWRDFMEFAHNWKPVEKWKKTAWVVETNISEISWLLPNPESSDSSYIIKSLFINKPKKYDNSYKQVQVDILCNWKVTENTPKAAIKTVTVLQLNCIDPKWQNAVNLWAKWDSFKKMYWNIPDLVTDISDTECKRTWNNSDITINTTINDQDTLYAWENNIQFEYKSINPIIKINVLIDDVIIEELEIEKLVEWSYSWTIFIPASKAWKNSIIKLEAVDDQSYSNIVSRKVMIEKK